MIKHTMQEIADFTGCYVAQDDISGDVYLYKYEPELLKSHGMWEAKVVNHVCDGYEIDRDFVSDADTHDWTKLVEPRVGCDKAQHNSDGSCLGLCRSENDDEPIEQCKNCKRCTAND